MHAKHTSTTQHKPAKQLGSNKAATRRPQNHRQSHKKRPRRSPDAPATTPVRHHRQSPLQSCPGGHTTSKPRSPSPTTHNHHHGPPNQPSSQNQTRPRDTHTAPNQPNPAQTQTQPSPNPTQPKPKPSPNPTQTQAGTQPQSPRDSRRHARRHPAVDAHVVRPAGRAAGRYPPAAERPPGRQAPPSCAAGRHPRSWPPPRTPRHQAGRRPPRQPPEADSKERQSEGKPGPGDGQEGSRAPSERGAPAGRFKGRCRQQGLAAQPECCHSLFGGGGADAS